MNATKTRVLCRVGSLLVGVAAASSCGSMGSLSAARADETAASAPPKMSQQQLQAELMAFADRFFAEILDAEGELESSLATPQARYDAAAARLAALTVTTDIAAGPNPGAALLDMTVFVTLKLIVWEEYWMPDVLGMSRSSCSTPASGSRRTSGASPRASTRRSRRRRSDG